MSARRVLIVDDDPDLRMLLDVNLKSAGYEVGSASDGISCLSKKKQFQPDLVILDLGLPAGDGISTLQRLRANASFSHVQVLVLSARRASEWRDKALQQGANAYLQKPVDKQTLLFHVQQLLGPSPAPALPASSQISCPHCGGSLDGMKFGIDEASIEAIARNLQRYETTR